MIGDDTGHGSAWCPTHRTWVYLADEYDTDTGDRTTPSLAYTARPLQCGHDAGDGGAPPPRRDPVDDGGLVERVVALQASDPWVVSW